MKRQHLPTESFLDMPKRMLDRYSIGELVRAAAAEDNATLAFYNEVSEGIAAKTGQQSSALRSYFVPSDIMLRDMTAASGPAGGYLVDAPVLDFAGALLASSLTSRLPLRRVPAKGNGSVAVMTNTPTTTWLSSEAAEAADAAPSFGSRAVTIKTVATVAWLSRQLTLQAPDSVRFVEQQLGRALAQAIDVAFVSGTGASGQPTGLLTLNGTTSESGTSIAYDNICTMISVAEGYGGTPWVLLGKDTAKLLRQRPKVSGSGPIFENGSVDGLPVVVTRSVPDAAMLVFDPTLITEVRWGALEVVITPLSSPDAFKRGAVGVRLIQGIDYVVDFPSVIVKSTSIT